MNNSIYFDEDLPCNYIEEDNECNICYEKFKESFKCNRCNFLSCPKCFYNDYFGENSKCPPCRKQLFKE